MNSAKFSLENVVILKQRFIYLKPFEKIIKHLPSARIKPTPNEFTRKTTCNDDDDDDEINLIISFN